MNLPRVVVFDLGKVLVDFDYSIATRAIATLCPTGHCDVHKLIDQSPLLFRFETGEIDRREFFAAVSAASNFNGNEDQFGKLFADIFTEIPEMTRLNRALRDHGLPTCIFSNTNSIAIEHISARFPFFRDFDAYIYSFDEGAMKPDPRIYAAVERATRRAGPEILYIDDRPENIIAGQSRGWQVILQQDPAETWARIRQLGLLN